MPGDQVGEQQSVLQPLQQLSVVVDDAGPVHAGNLLQRSEIHVETFAVVVVPEILEAGVGGGLRVQYVGVERAVGRHHRHHVADLPGFGAEAGLGQVVEMDDGSFGIGPRHLSVLLSSGATYVTLSFVMTTDLGRPRDPRIDNAVLRATVELLGKSGYADLSVDAIAKRAGTSKPAIYRRWPSKAHLVHEAVFPINSGTELPDTGSLAGDVREMVRRTVAVLTTPAARAPLRGLGGQMAAAR